MITDEMVEDGCRGFVAHLSEAHGQTIEWPGLYREYERYRVRAQVRAVLEAVERAAWQPIETAPKDGRSILLYGGNVLYDSDWTQTPNPLDNPSEGYWNMSRYSWELGNDEGQGNYVVVDSPTHWRNLPDHP